jgi:hypothetical protein
MAAWKDLQPDERLRAALDQADRERGSRSALIEEGSSSDKNNWSNTFADACARMVATAIRDQVGSRLTVLPDPDGTAEPPTITYQERGQLKRKKIDVLVGDLIAGLQIAISLKGVGFRDQTQLSFGKNITGRLYELENEARRLHEYRPQAVVVGLYFMPVGAVADKKTSRSASGFADLVRISVHSRAGQTPIVKTSGTGSISASWVSTFPATPNGSPPVTRTSPSASHSCTTTRFHGESSATST